MDAMGVESPQVAPLVAIDTTAFIFSGMTKNNQSFFKKEADAFSLKLSLEEHSLESLTFNYQGLVCANWFTLSLTM